MSDREYHRVAVVVFVEAKGVDERDAQHLATDALRELARPGTTIPAQHRIPEYDGEPVRVCDYVEAGMAMGNGYLWARPTSRPFRQYQFPWNPPEEES